MKIKDFAVERYFARYEFTAQYLLSSSDCDGYAMQDVLDLASDKEQNSWNELTLGYTETIGSDPLRAAIQTHYQTIQMDEIVVASPGEANFILMNVLLEKGDEVVCMLPSYQSLYQVAKDLGCTIVPWKPSEEAGKWDFSIADLKNLISDKTKLIVVNFPHNPTGYSPTLSEYRELIELASHHNITVFSDEMYRFLTRPDAPDLPAMCDLYDNCVSLWGTSKTFGLAGLRIGWITSKNKELLKKVEKFKDYLSICNSAPSEILATIALNNMDSLLQPNLTKIIDNCAHFAAFHQRHEQLISFHPPVSGSTAFVRLNMPETALHFAEKLVKDTGIMLLPGELFEYGQAHTRIGFGRKNMPEILEIFEEFLFQYNS
ncbi:MAG: aminotransferase class I/II-fold pyridoxal phosphate-dependent enzyme [Crocinitomicaceae bacterium]|nr:aminotransferase class I/II-fold pyridoxal phosphate-dependent enzyme [Crocinitomicaceae bacterium]